MKRTPILCKYSFTSVTLYTILFSVCLPKMCGNEVELFYDEFTPQSSSSYIDNIFSAHTAGTTPEILSLVLTQSFGFGRFRNLISVTTSRFCDCDRSQSFSPFILILCSACLAIAADIFLCFLAEDDI